MTAIIFILTLSSLGGQEWTPEKYHVGKMDHLNNMIYDCLEKQQLEQDMEQQTGSKLGKKYIKAVYCTLLI